MSAVRDSGPLGRTGGAWMCSSAPNSSTWYFHSSGKISLMKRMPSSSESIPVMFTQPRELTRAVVFLSCWGSVAS